MFLFRFFIGLTLLSLTACIGDDIIEDTVEEKIQLSNPIDSLKTGANYQFDASYLNNVGQVVQKNIAWVSKDESILTISSTGLATGISEGTAEITASTQDANGQLYTGNFSFEVSATLSQDYVSSIRSGVIQTTSSYVLEGDFEIERYGNGIRINIADNYRASSSLPGLVLYLTNNPATNAGALEVASVTTFSGTHSYTIPNVDIAEYQYLLYYCKPFSVKVGDGKIE